MDNERSGAGYAFPIVDGVIQGRVTKIRNGFLGISADGEAFAIANKEQLIATFQAGVTMLADKIIEDLSGVNNAEDSVSFTISTEDPMSALFPVGIDDDTKRAMLQFMSSIGNGGGISLNTTGRSRKTNLVPIQSEDLSDANVIDEESDSIDKNDLDKINTEVENGKEVVVEQRKKKRYHN